ncbi:MAG: glycosyltransferase [Candidatus Acinetobacter avistercoris]|nr:glycosyltransferase [Candidatus Acinetobacter avistercoris]
MLVTVYIPTFNRLHLLKRAINSVLNQSYENIEIIIVDDYSSDGTQEFLKEISSIDQRIKIFLKEKNGGACESRNIAIQASQGEYITGLDDDDYFLPNRIENFIKNLNSDAKAVLYFDSPLIKVDQREDIDPPTKAKILNWFKPKKIYAQDLLVMNYIGNQVFIKTDILKISGAFDTEMPMWQDLECWYHVLKITQGYAKRLSTYTYVVDISHELDRISNFKIEKGKKAFKHFSKKHLLSSEDSQILFCHLYEYNKELIKLSPLFKKLYKGFNLQILLNTIKNIFLFFKR